MAFIKIKYFKKIKYNIIILFLFLKENGIIFIINEFGIIII